jgi:hypothetical protein
MPDNKSGSDNPVYGSVGLAELSVTSQKLAEGAIVTQKIRDRNVTSAKLADAAVSSDKIAAAAVSTDKIADAAISTDKIADGAVTAAEIAGGAVGSAQLAGDINLTGSPTINGKSIVLAQSGSELPLSMVRGSFNANGSIAQGAGYSVSKPTTGRYDITFSPAFSAAPTVTFTLRDIALSAPASVPIITAISASGVTVVNMDAVTYGLFRDCAMHFIAIGPR